MERGQRWILPAILIAGAAIAWALIFSSATGYPARPNGITSLKVSIAIITVAALGRFLRYFFCLWKAGVERPISRIRIDFRPALAAFVPILAGVAIIGTFLYSITFLKSMISAVVPFWADAPLAAIDRAMFINPAAIAVALQPSLPSLGLFYGLWHAVNLGGILWVLHWRRDNKSQHIVSFMLTWSIGMALAYIFSSAGPIFTGRYDPSLAPGSVQKAAELLWTNYKADGALLGGGISAFPSMHVAIAAWFALVLRERGLLWLGIAYAFSVFACSVILGWHYVADGIAGAGVALVADRLSWTWLRPRGFQFAHLALPTIGNWRSPG